MFLGNFIVYLINQHTCDVFKDVRSILRGVSGEENTLLFYIDNTNLIYENFLIIRKANLWFIKIKW